MDKHIEDIDKDYAIRDDKIDQSKKGGDPKLKRLQ